MDALDQFKEQWKNQSDNFVQHDKVQLTNILKRKSTNLVKWIFVFGLVEFGLWALLSLVFHDQSTGSSSNSEIFVNFSNGLEIVSYAILIYFLFRFYANYKRISMVENTKQLMTKIIKTRKTVKLYVGINIALLVIGTIAALFLMVNYDPELMATVRDIQTKQPNEFFYLKLAGVTLVVLTVACLLLLLVYWLTYGTLLRRLKVNYKLLQDSEE